MKALEHLTAAAAAMDAMGLPNVDPEDYDGDDDHISDLLHIVEAIAGARFSATQILIELPSKDAKEVL